MPAARYRVFDFGTIYLTQAQRQSPFMVVGVEVQNARRDFSESGKRLPPQGVWAYLTQRWQDWVDGPEIDIRFRKQRHVLWSEDPSVTTFSTCLGTNGLYQAVMTELAKKPNIPPLPPSLPPAGNLVSNAARTLIARPGSISVKSTCESDLDIYLWWGSPTDDGSGPCAPLPIPDPPTPPVAPVLPQPSGAWNGPQFPVPPSLPPGTAPLGGGSLVLGSPFSGDQSLPPTTLTSTRFTVLTFPSGAESQGCVVPAPVLLQSPVFPGILSPESVSVVLGGNDGQTGLPCGATRYDRSWVHPTLGVLFSISANGVAPPGPVQAVFS